MNLLVFDMDLGGAIEAPRFASDSFRSSFEPHDYWPGRLMVEGQVPAATLDRLRALGHDAIAWPDFTAQAGGVCAVLRDGSDGMMLAAADPRRSIHAVGW